MRGAWIDGGGPRLRLDLPAPAPGAGESRVQVLKVGVCATDLALARGYMGFRGIPGHEFIGRALEGPLRGQRVVGEINAACGRCDTCVRGEQRHCPERSVLGILGRPGALAEELALPDRNLHALPDSISDEAAVFCEPLAAAYEILEQLGEPRPREALVLGDGRLGLLCAQVLRSAGILTRISGRHPERSRLVPGLEWTEPAAARGVELVVEATGDPDALRTALECVRPRGTIVLKTTSERQATLDLAPVVVNEVRILGSRCGPFEPALGALARREIVVEPLIQARYPLDEVVTALQEAGRRGVLKVVVEVSG